MRVVMGSFIFTAMGSQLQSAPDFAAIARACQCHGEKVETSGQIRPALERALVANAQGVPALIDFVVARERVAGSIDFFAKR